MNKILWLQTLAVENYRSLRSIVVPLGRLNVIQGANGPGKSNLSQALRLLHGTELSDGTLRFLLWLAALLTPRPASMMVLNEPETSLHPDLLPALSQLIIEATKSTQLWVVTHSPELISMLQGSPETRVIELDKHFGQTQVKGQELFDRPQWRWVE